jgi:hypothetical protein
MSNEFKLSHGSMERKRRQSITLTAIEIERLASEGAHCSGKGNEVIEKTSNNGFGRLHSASQALASSVTRFGARLFSQYQPVVTSAGPIPNGSHQSNHHTVAGIQ